MNDNVIIRKFLMLRRSFNLYLLRRSPYITKTRIRHHVWLLWSNRSKIFLALLISVGLLRTFLFFWFVNLPPEEPTFLCSFGKGQ